MKTPIDIIKAVLNEDELKARIHTLEQDLNETIDKYEKLCVQERQISDEKFKLQLEKQNDKNIIENINFDREQLSQRINEFELQLIDCRDTIEKLELEKEKLESELNKIRTKKLDTKTEGDNLSEKLPEDEIIYLTGMSINKKTFHNVYNIMSEDTDFDDAKNYLHELIKKLHTIIADYGKEIKHTNSKELFDNFSQTQINNILTRAAENVFGQISFVGIFTQAIKFISNRDAKKLDEGVYGKELLQLIYQNKKIILNCIEGLRWVDFFSIFQSNQSDLRGINAIASGDTNAFALNYGYSDKPFYENLFINSLTIETTEKFKQIINDKEFNSTYGSAYTAHSIDIIGSRILKESIFEASKKAYMGNNIRELYSAEAEKNVKQSLDNRNLFGIDLLSRFLSLLVNKVQDVYTDKNISFSTIKVYAKSRGRVTIFTEELFEYGSCPSTFEFVNDKHHADLIIDCQYLNNEVLEPKQVISQPNSVIIPIKYFIALPIYLDDKGNQIPSREIYVPERIVHNASDNKVMNVYAVGGIEHNRPLMRLVNIHRQQNKDERQLGFFDNHFDYHHKFENLTNPNYKHYFLMGANQLVSGLNEFHYERTDDYTGNSISTDAKLIYFNLTDSNSYFLEGCDDLTWNIVSIYGFSALASAYATLWTIINIKQSVENPEVFITSEREERKYSKSLAFKAIHLQDSARFKDNMNVYTRRIKFQKTNLMESRLKEICNNLEPFSYLRLDYLLEPGDRDLVNFMLGKKPFENDDSHAVVDIVDGRANTK